MSTIKAYAPGRVELLGNHTDYNEGYVLSAAIDRGVEAIAERREDDHVSFTSDGFPLEVTQNLAAIERQETGSWANYPLGVVKEFLREGFPIGGWEASYASDLPVGAGLSSSAAMEVATAQAMVKLFGLTLSRMQMAKMCKRAENEFVGVNSGLLDQVSSIFGRRQHAIYLDCRTEEVRLVPFPESVTLVVINSGVSHALIGGEYNERREQCFRAAEILKVPFLRDATMAMLEAARNKMDDVTYRRAKHVVGENERVQAAVTLLRKGEIEQVGKLMFASHESSRTNFENSTPELDLLVELAQAQHGVLGSRLTGGGFGGATISVVYRDDAARAGAAIALTYKERSGNVTEPFVCEIADGAH